MQDGGIKDGCIELTMAIYQFRLNVERVCVRFYGSINPIESVKLPSITYFDESKMATSKMAVSKMASFCCIASKHRFVPADGPQLHSTTILEGNIGRYHYLCVSGLVARRPAPKCGFRGECCPPTALHRLCGQRYDKLIG